MILSVSLTFAVTSEGHQLSSNLLAGKGAVDPVSRYHAHWVLGGKINSPAAIERTGSRGYLMGNTESILNKYS